MEKLTRNLGEEMVLNLYIQNIDKFILVLEDQLNIPEPFKDPAKVCKALGSLVVVGEEEVVEESDGQPDQGGAEEEELPGDQLHPPGTNSQQ